jgi:hypothetical protein
LYKKKQTEQLPLILHQYNTGGEGLLSQIVVTVKPIFYITMQTILKNCKTEENVKSGGKKETQKTSIFQCLGLTQPQNQVYTVQQCLIFSKISKQ